jgi:hypothetical protein
MGNRLTHGLGGRGHWLEWYGEGWGGSTTQRGTACERSKTPLAIVFLGLCHGSQKGVSQSSRKRVILIM